jgi:hypothetical protein
MPKFSVITCISDPEIYQNCLLDSIDKQRGPHSIEIIPVLNESNLYTASLALNLGIDASRSDWLVMAHQDVRLLDDWFTRAEKHISQLENWAILGCAGISLDYERQDIGGWGGSIRADTIAVGSVWGGDNTDQKPYWDGLKQPTKVHCIDECLFIYNKQAGLRFDTHFNGFHFYGVDLCLQARVTQRGVYAAHLPLIHYGKYSASMVSDLRYWRYFRMLHHKWKDRFPELLGTHMHWAEGELTSYIPIELESQDKINITIKAVTIQQAALRTDKNTPYIGYEC